MRQAARAVFVSITEPLEGLVVTPYACLKAVVTIYLGNATFSPAQFAALPLRHVDGRLATQVEKVGVYHAIINGCCGAKSTATNHGAYRTCLWPGKMRDGKPCFQHTGWRAARDHVSPRLSITREDGDVLVWAVLNRMWGQLVNRWRAADPDTWPADSHLGVISWCWGVGPAARFALLDRALLARDFKAAAEQITMRGAGTIIQRNAKNQLLMRNAGHVERLGLDPDRLYYPATLTGTETRPPPEPDTLTEMPGDDGPPDCIDPYADDCGVRDWLEVPEGIIWRREATAIALQEGVDAWRRDRYTKE